MDYNSPGKFVKGRRARALLAATCLAFGASMAPVAAHAALILAFSQIGTANTVTGTATGGSTTIGAVNDLIFISALDQPGFAGASAYLNFSALSNDVAAVGADGNVRQNYSGVFTITSGTDGTGINYLSGTYNDLFEGLNASATLIASTPPASQVTFTSGVIPEGDLGVDRAVSFSFTAVTPGITSAVNGTIPNFTAGVSGNFSAEKVLVPEPISLALVGTGLLGIGLLRRKNA